MAQQMVRQAVEARWVGVEGALLFARVARAVRQTIGMERTLGAHCDAATERQRAKLYALMNAGGTLIQRLTRQNLDRNFLDGPGGMMMLRLTTATERTMLLLVRLDDERALPEARRDAIWKRRSRRSRPVARAPQAPAPAATATQAASVAAPPPGQPSDMSLGQAYALLAGSMDDIEGMEKRGEDPALVGDTHARDESLSMLSVEEEIGDRSLAEIAKAACRVVGMVPAAKLVDEAAAERDASATEVDADSPTSPGLSAPAGRRGEDEDKSSPASDTGTGSPSVVAPTS